jgi:hypothetical protein
VVEGRGDALLSSVNHAVTRGYIYGAGAVTVMEMLREPIKGAGSNYSIKKVSAFNAP